MADTNVEQPVENVQAKRLVKIIMPSEGDMELVEQKGGVLLLKPVYFGGECAGPIVQIVSYSESSSGAASPASVEAAYRIKIKSSGDVKLAKAE